MLETAHTPIVNLQSDPLLSLAMGEIEGVLALVIRTQGPSYRAVGAAMVFHNDGTQTGSLSSGCIEADLAIHAATTRKSNVPLRVIYGDGSPFIDIKLPCGGGLEILLLPQPKPDELALMAEAVTLRHAVVLCISLETGRILRTTPSKNGISGNTFSLNVIPPLQFVTFGKGPEAVTFAKLIKSLAFRSTLVSPDLDTIREARFAECETYHIVDPNCPDSIELDDRTAVVCFFHEHEWEAPILCDVIDRDLFYIGCQGSKQTSARRHAELERLGVSQKSCQKVKGPIGLIASVRDSKTLAVSVLAEILDLQ